MHYLRAGRKPFNEPSTGSEPLASDQPQRRRRISLPDKLATMRILLVPFVMWLIVDVAPENSWLAAIVFVIAAVTDFLDGYIARKQNITTVLGAFLDGTADKMLVTGTLLALLAIGRVSMWVVLIIVTRELVVTALRGLAALEGHLVRPSMWGKIKANAQFVALFLAIVRVSEPWGPWFLDEYVMWLAVVVTVLSGWQYVSRFWKVAIKVDAVAAE